MGTVTATTATDNYTTTIEIVRKAGIGREIANESVGTGNSTNKSFDLDNGNVIAGTYTIKVQTDTTTNANVFTTLTEGSSDDYTIDKDSGSITLESAGITALGTKVLYADYIHSPKVSDSIISSYLNEINEEVDRKTGKFWGTPTARINYLDGRNLLKYPTTDRPYALFDRDPKDRVQLDRGNVTEIVHVYFLNRGVGFSEVLNFDDSESTYSNDTTEANSVGGTAFDIYAASPGNADIIYFGSGFIFGGITNS